ncbi:glycosyltransferase [Microbacterium sp. YJN-G]|uniref:glycosyltransferase n=1 Tax=Microbacterium sp. YJN-G TaxID=2763257 RepID=UPI001878AB01|nr:glycosyltransferase [Microbacterium sp. YJN-G]
MTTKIVAVVPVFGAPDTLPQTIARLATQVDAVVLVDDGSHTVESMRFGDSVFVISLPVNAGIATALNVAIDRARELGATHVITLDQDSELGGDHVARLLELLERGASDGARVAGAVPGVVGGAPVLLGTDGEPFDPIQSGQLLPITLFDEIGGFNTELFIDAVDSEFTIRARQAGYRFLVDPELEMAHALGEAVPLHVMGRPLILLGKPRHVLYHSPWRTYYMVRNSVWLARRYGHGDPEWMRRRNRKMTEMLVGGILLAPDRMTQLRAARAGWKDGTKGTLGRIPEQLRLQFRRRV